MEGITGIITALITPFTENGMLDTEGLRSNIRFQIAAQVDGIVALGTTGETPTLSKEEKEQVIRIAVEEAKGKIKVIIGTGCNSTRETIAQTKHAEALGADAALVVAPYYNKPTQEGLFLHYQAVTQNTRLPLILYNVPGRCGQNIDPKTVQRLAALKGIAGIKEASGNIQQIADLLHALSPTHPHFHILSGDDSLTLPVMALGGCGIISVISNLVPKEVVQMVRAIEKGHFLLAKQLNHRLHPLFRAAFVETNPIPIKEAMNACGMPAGPCRLPLCSMSKEAKQQLYLALEQMQLLTAEEVLR